MLYQRGVQIPATAGGRGKQRPYEQTETGRGCGPMEYVVRYTNHDSPARRVFL